MSTSPGSAARSPQAERGEPGSRAGRRPQAERSLASRNRILDAAVACLLEDGYARTNTLTIQARAGVSRGRLLHQFPSKDELLVAAAHHVFTAGVLAGVGDELPEARTPGERIDAVIELLWHSFTQPQFWAATELWVAARTEPSLAEVVRPAERRLGRAIWARMDALFGPQIAAHPMYPALRQAMFTSMRGVMMSYSFDPRDPRSEPALANWKQLARCVLLGDVVNPAAAPRPTSGRP
jgi:AcrR family transcriptional regulator